MNDLSSDQIAWIAGIYEGEGCCTLRERTAVRIEIVMTDYDIIERLFVLTGLGTIRGPKQREGSKPYWVWGVGGVAAIEFLQMVRPWLGNRRGKRADQAIERREANRVNTRVGDTHCLHGHELTPDNLRPSGNGKVCRTCANVASRKYRLGQKAQIEK